MAAKFACFLNYDYSKAALSPYMCLKAYPTYEGFSSLVNYTKLVPDELFPIHLSNPTHYTAMKLYPVVTSTKTHLSRTLISAQLHPN